MKIISRIFDRKSVGKLRYGGNTLLCTLLADICKLANPGATLDFLAADWL